jgi:DNA-binding GntR family transcriptional regulator
MPDWDPADYRWRQIADTLEARIVDGSYPIGSNLPSEQTLAREFGSGKMTVRRALVELRARGLVVTLHGRGSVVVASRRPQEAQ